MKIHYSNLQIVKTPKMKLLENRTVQWFLYGDPNFFDNAVIKMQEKMHEEMEQRLRNTLLYGTSHPEMYK